ncbi:carbohydrate-binding protein with CBM35 doain [Frondihabitans sp. PhB188]|uniref:CBM35 domain-containing protein n=1 Tax=Frondihabitans sp. PhB188 TaxID=2485200 RepID=UPI000FA1AF9E|nr:CBM35 domain-containing protein [Frondihabitans sp. PhB188]ROQ39781.1 carbohydrate-binding protein with CBM35 doain [Frondihabitans sp. PhB188]
MKKRTITSAIAASALVATSVFAFAGAAQAETNTLVVNAGATLRPVTHAASGGLYALATTTTPDPALLPPLHLSQLTQPAPGVTQLGNGATTPTGDALKVAPSAIGAGAQTTVRMPDIYPDFPYKWVSMSDYLSKVDTMVKARLAATSTTNINGWELWNEPDGNWDTAKAGPFNDAWVQIYREVRSLDTVTPIVGPSYSQYNHATMVAFLTNAKNTGTIPDVTSWHELDSGQNGWARITSDVADYRAVETSLGISPRPISINEYAAPDQVDVPSAALHYVAQFERAGVRDAERAYWFESGTVNGLLYNGAPTASYWMYKWYGDMAGSMLPVTASNYLDGIASLDSTRKKVDVVFGGQAGTTTVRVDGLSGFGTQVKATLSYTPGSGRQTNVAAPTSLGSQTLPVTNGSVSVPVSANADYNGAYQLTVTPVAGPTTAYQQTYEAENATVVNASRLSSSTASNGGYVGRIDGSSDMRSDSFVDFLVTVPTAGSYNLAVRYANGGTATSTQGLAYNGGAFSTVSYPVTGSWGSFANSVTTPVTLKAGSNVIRLAKGSPNYAGGSGYAELDSITVTPR